MRVVCTVESMVLPPALDGAGVPQANVVGPGTHEFWCYESELPTLYALVEHDQAEVERCKKKVDADLARFQELVQQKKARPDGYNGPRSWPAMFHRDNNGRDPLPLLSVEVIDEAAPPATDEQNSLERFLKVLVDAGVLTAPSEPAPSKKRG